jgi:hypothetical protein
LYARISAGLSWPGCNTYVYTDETKGKEIRVGIRVGHKVRVLGEKEEE